MKHPFWLEWFDTFYTKVRQTSNWRTMEQTVEGSEWHREANVAVHTDMAIKVFLVQFASERTPRQCMYTLTALLFHDFGKPEAEETLERKDGSGTTYHRYAGHEPISANEFLSFMMDNHDLREDFFAQGFGWNDIRAIKVMIEHHLPYGLKRPEKVSALRSMLHHTLGDQYVCFYDMLRSDGLGRISDNHEEKTKNVNEWIETFDKVAVLPIDTDSRLIRKGLQPFAIMDGLMDHSRETRMRLLRERQRTLWLPVGVSGAGKSTWIKEHFTGNKVTDIFSEDDLRLQYAMSHFNEVDLIEWVHMTTQEQYDVAWKFCHLNKESKFDAFSKAEWKKLMDGGNDVVLDRMNQGKKARGKFIEDAKQHGFIVRSAEFFISEKEAVRRQAMRGDKMLPAYRVHQICMQLETPWYGPEVDSFYVIPMVKS